MIDVVVCLFIDIICLLTVCIISMTGSQFLITLKPTPFLDGKHTIFGRIASGITVIQRIGLVATKKDDDRPLHPVVIHRATAIQGGLLLPSSPSVGATAEDFEDDGEEQDTIEEQ